MTTKHLVDLEIREFCENFPILKLKDEAMPEIREGMHSMLGELDAPPNTVSRKLITIPGYNGSPDVKCYLYSPTNASPGTPGYLHIHGGGMVVGSPEHTDTRCASICDRLGATVLSVGYRLAPENPYPAALYDCYAALRYLHKSADEFNIDTTRIGIGGESAGGGLAASLAIFARDKGEYSVCHQQLVFPMIDDRTGAIDVEIAAHLGEFIWTKTNNQYGWKSYLGNTSPDKANIPARTENLSNLPPAWIGVGDLDLFFPENEKYAQRLVDAGGRVSMTVYNQAPHGFYMAPESTLSRKFDEDFMHSLSIGLSVSI